MPSIPQLIYWPVNAYLLFMSVIWLIRLARGFRIRDEKIADFQSSLLAVGKERDFAGCPHLFILLPMLREQRCINEAVEHFSQMPYPGAKTLVIITTQREKKEKLDFLQAHRSASYASPDYKEILRFIRINSSGDPIQDFPSTESAIDFAELLPSTSDLADELASDSILHLHYPEAQGVMAHQLNFAIKELKLSGLANSDAFYAIYNADSRPEENTFLELLFQIEQDPSKQVFQQLSLYLNNIPSKEKWWQDSVLRGAAWWQCRWSFGWEIPHTRDHAVFLARYRDRKINSFDSLSQESMVYTIGHGLFVKDEILQTTGLFPEATMNEDAGFGLLLNWKRIPINLLGHLDRASIPESVAVLRKQKCTWYWGVLQAFSYPKHFPDFEKIDCRLFHLSFSLFLQAVCWFVNPAMIAASLLSGLMLGPVYFAGSLFMPALFLCLPHRTVAEYLRERTLAPSYAVPGWRIKDVFFEYVGAIVFFSIHWFGAATCLYQSLIWAITGNRPVKLKTEG